MGNRRFIEKEDATTIGDIIKWFFIIGVVLTVCFYINRACSVANSVADVAAQTLNAKNILAKYENFKNIASQIDRHKATIIAYQEDLKTITDREERNQIRAEMRGVIGIHNGLVAQYNADMAKANYAFCNKGQMPQSNMEPLPREFQNYVTSFK